MSEQIEGILRDLASQLGITTEYLWTVLVSHAPIRALQLAILGLIPLSIGIAGAWLSRKLFKRAETIGAGYSVFDDAEGCTMFAWISLGFAVASAAIALDTYAAAIIAYLHPEYWALQQILGVL